MMRISKMKMMMFCLLSLCLISDIHASYNGADFFVIDKATGAIGYKEVRSRYRGGSSIGRYFFPGKYAPPVAYNNPHDQALGHSRSFIRHVRGGGGGIGAIRGGNGIIEPCGIRGGGIVARHGCSTS
ncbi:hypothetical protein CTI12_AA438780 [Artemisia annua]|uniref:Uncharacterized protein n=1 Tax=Artemisia annua TaxID=35608 RepID=A0A2U1LYR3_ARTAN|nr:hypothetical protein CTI12_AA438780 [Artemisia annua]